MLTCVIAQNTRDKLLALKSAATEAGAHVVGESTNGLDALKLTHAHTPDALIVSGVLPVMDARDIGRQIELIRLYKRPALIVTRTRDMDVIVTQARAYISQSVPPAELKCALKDALPLPASARDIRRAHSLLGRMGIPECEGRAYMAQAIALTLNDVNWVRRLTRGVYIQVAQTHHTTPRRVGDTIRRVIEKAWTMGDIERQYSFFGNTIDDERGKPTCGGLIALCADILRMEGADLK